MRRVFAHLIDIRPVEAERVLASAVFFFCALFGFFLLRPARESLGVENTEEVIKYLYVGTLLVTAVGNPVFGWMVSRFPRRIFVPWTYRFFMVNIAVFGVLLLIHPAAAKGEAPTEVRVWLSRCYYVWVTVFALFNTMVFWAVMSDTFRLDQSKRVYPPIAVGGTIGALAGGSFAWWIAGKIGTPWVVLAAILALECVVWCFFWVDRAAARAEARGDHRETGVRCAACGYDLRGIRGEACPECGSAAKVAEARSIGGDAWGGFVRTIRSPYLIGTGGYIVLMSITSTFFYFAQLRIVESSGVTSGHRTAMFAQIELWSQAGTLLVQLFLTSHMLRRVGVGVTLATLPAIAIVAFGAMALYPTFGVMAIAQAFYRSGRFAFARPARETLFTVLDREDRYKSKAFVDTFLFRAGDVAGAIAETQAKSLSKALSSAATDATVAALRIGALAIGGIGIVWAGLGLWLGRAQRRMVAERDTPSADPNGARATDPAPG